MEFKQSYGEYQHVSSGKVREIYENKEDNTLLLVATDRVSAFDQVLGIEIPDKGKILTAISAEIAARADRMGLTTAYYCSNAPRPNVVNPWGSIEEFEHASAEAILTAAELQGRVTIMEKLDMLPVECIVRGHISGSAWKLYEQGAREICGVSLPDGLKNGDRLPEPIFTPTTKAAAGQHDENITFEEMCKLVGDSYIAEEARKACLDLFAVAHDFFYQEGVILADTKFELGHTKRGWLAFGDEILTPDSSRYWDAETFVPGEEPLSYDKQIIRNYLAGCKARGETDLTIPDEILAQTRQRYISLYEKITSCPWPE